MSNYNRCIFIGHLTRQPEMRYTQEGKAVTKFTIAVNRYKKDEADFIRMVAFGKTGEVCGEYLNKGSKVLIDGRLQISSYEKDGNTVWSTEIVVGTMEMLTPKQKEDHKQEPDEPEEVEESIDDEDDDIPF